MPTVSRGTDSLVGRIAPGIASLRSYERGWLRQDLVAGLVLTALLVPQGMAYAELAGLPPITGLYTTVLCLLGYAVFGPSPRPGARPRLGAGTDDRGDRHSPGRGRGRP